MARLTTMPMPKLKQNLKIWFKKSVRDIRAFRVEDWSDFTAIFKQ